MRILALLPDDSLRTVQRCIGSRDILARAATAGELVDGANPRTVDAVVIDPLVLDEAEWASVRAALRLARVPVLLYSSLVPEALRRVLAAAAHGTREVLFRGVDDDPAAVQRRLAALGSSAPPALLLTSLATHIARLPSDLQRATVPLFCAGPVPRWANDVARSADMPRRSVDRWMLRAGLSGTASLLDIARLARTWVPMVVQHGDLTEIAIAAGYRRERMLALHARRIVGVSPAFFGTRLSAEDFVARLALHVVRD